MARVHQQPLNERGRRTSSVQGDWHAWLPSIKEDLFTACAQYLEAAYNMFSVALNEALDLRRCGKLGKSNQVISLTPALCKRLADALTGLLRALNHHAKQYRIISNAAPLNAADFQGVTCQRTARINALLTHVLLPERSQFRHKIAALLEMLNRLEADFRVAAEELGMGISLNPSADWRTVDIGHYDMNTCLRETLILLKSFLLSIPDEQLGEFQQAVKEQMRPAELPRRSVYSVQPRRMAAGGGK